MPTVDRRRDLEALAADLVRIETENPPGNERACAEFVVDWFAARDVEARLVDDPYADRPQAAARVGDGDPTVVLNGHLDVVPAGDPDEWEHDPYGAEIRDGKLYGRGSADMKTGLAVAMTAMADLKEPLEAGELDGSIVMHAAIGEETADPGTKRLLETGFDGDYGVVLEPTDFRTATSSKGLVCYEIDVFGDPSHASRPDQGRNAIRESQAVLDAFREYDRRLRRREDDLVGSAYATVTQFEAGTGTNLAVLPERATFVLDRRLLPDDSVAEVDEEVAAVLAAVEREQGVETEWTRIQEYESASIPVDHPLAELFRERSRELAGVSTEPWGIEAATDVRNFVNDAGIDAITWGPGSLAQAHTQDEHIDLADAAAGLEILDRCLRELLAA